MMTSTRPVNADGVTPGGTETSTRRVKSWRIDVRQIHNAWIWSACSVAMMSDGR